MALTGLHVSDQTLTGDNLALYNHYREGNPIRVSGGSNVDSSDALPTEYKYEGVYIELKMYGVILDDMDVKYGVISFSSLQILKSFLQPIIKVQILRNLCLIN